MGARYTVSAYDRCGEFDSHGCGDDFDEALELYVDWRKRYAGKTVQLANLDEVDLGRADGLTEYERERMYWAEEGIDYWHIRHAAHYAYSHPAKGHDLDQWSYQQADRLPVPPTIPSDAEYHSGFVRDGLQWWVYIKRAPLSEGVCEHCKSISLVDTAKSVLGIK